MMKLLSTISFFLLLHPLFSQLKPIGSWTDHLPFRSGNSLTTDGEVLYAGTNTGLFTYSTEDNSINKFSKVNILNDVEIAHLNYSVDYNTLVVVYKNANVDLITNGITSNIPFIKLSDEQKEVYEIKLIDRFAYLSTAFGISVIDIVNKEIVDSYKLGSGGSALKINSTSILGNTIFAASDEGIYSASLNSNLLDFNSWTKEAFKPNATFYKLFEVDNGFVAITNEISSADSVFLFDGTNYSLKSAFNGQKYKSLSKTTSNQHVFNTLNKTYILDNNFNIVSEYNRNNGNSTGGLVSSNGRIFVLNSFNPLLELDPGNGAVILTIRPNGPFEKDIFDIDIEQGILWAAGGGHDFTYNNSSKFARIYKYDGSSWTNYLEFAEPSIKGIIDVLSVSVNPENGEQAFFGSWFRGMVEFRDKLPFRVYQDTNTNDALKIRVARAGERWIGVGESDFDPDGNLWMTNSYQRNGMAVRKRNGSWKGFDLSAIYSSEETTLYDIAVDNNGYKWIALPKDNAIIVYDDAGTIDNEADDRFVVLTSEAGQGSIPGARGIKIEVDKDGLIWIGTSDGIAVHFNPGGVFEGDRDFDRIIFFDGENNEIVLKNSTVKEIAIDGFNRKWIGTENSGVILLSEDGKETILEFNEDNSPILSNTINAISIDDISGEVYIATSKGLLSYRAEAVGGSEDFSNINIFPNPVRPEYSGNIAISGLLDNSTVKITDINGTLINELQSEGGQVLWDGNNFNGRRASTGVYLIFMSGQDEDGDLETEVGKLLFIN